MFGPTFQSFESLSKKLQNSLSRQKKNAGVLNQFGCVEELDNRLHFPLPRQVKDTYRIA